MSRSRSLYDRHGLLAEYEDGVLVYCRDGDLEQDNCSGTTVIRDIEPYKSMITGEMITSRTRHRDHLRAHGCIEVGNDTSHIKPRQQETTKTSLRESISRRLGDMSDRQANQILSQLRRGH